jgi:tRNA-dihydrouridine synthase C
VNPNPSLPPDFLTDGKPKIFLAPMEGVVDHVTREMITDIGGIDLCVTEFIRVLDQSIPDHVFFRDAIELTFNGEGTAISPRRSHTKSGVPLLVQLLGADPARLGENAARAVELGAAGIDLNFGCPAKTVNRHDGGATLLKDPSRVEKAVRGVRESVPKTHSVSAKTRLGFSDKVLHREIAQAAEAGGASWLTVHARTRDEGYKPPAHWEFIAHMREAVKIPVIANGDVWTPEDYKKMLEVSGCTHAMLGRGILARPSLALECKGIADKLTWEEMKPHVLRFVKTSEAARGQRFATSRIKQWLKSLSLTYIEAQELFERVKRIETLSSELFDINDV